MRSTPQDARLTYDDFLSGCVFLAPFDVLFSKWDVVEPDLIVLTSDQADILTDKNVQGAPALVVEVLSPGARKVDEQMGRVQVDEIWSFTYAKKKNVTQKFAEKVEGAGDTWTWTAIDADSKLVISWLVGGRGLEYAVPFMNDLRARLESRAAYQRRPQSLFDGC